jgi:putative ABC transport system permease protein
VWVREPVVLARFPGVLFAVLGAALVLALTAAGGPLFVSSAQNASLAESLAGRSPEAFRVVAFAPLDDAFLSRADQEVGTQSADAGVGAARLGIAGSALAIRAEGAGTSPQVQVTPIAIEGFTDHLDGSTAGAGPGLWIDRRTATALRVTVGDRLEAGPADGPATVTVAGVFERPADPSSAFWAPIRDVLTDHTETPAFIARDDLFALGSEVGGRGRYEWQVPLLGDRLSLPQAEALAGHFQQVAFDAQDPDSAFAAAFQSERFGSGAPFASTPLPGLVDDANRTANATRGPVDTISTAGWMLALFGVAAAGTYGVRRRRIEAALLGARGAGPLLQGARASLEAFLPIAIGGAAGIFGAIALVRAIGPSEFIDGAATSSAIRGATLTLVAALVLLGLASGIAARTELEEASTRVRRALSRAPWEAVVLVAALASLYEVRSQSGVAAGGEPHVDRLLVLFPVLFIAGVSGVAMRGASRLLGRARSLGSRWRAGPYLAIRRLTSAPRMALLLITGASLALGLLVFAGTVASSVRDTAQQKSLVRVGSDVAVPLPITGGFPEPPTPASTVVVRYSGHTVPGNDPVEVIAIDLRSFPAGAYWNAGFSSASLTELMDRLAASTSQPAIVGTGPAADTNALVVGGSQVSVRSVGRASLLPGAPSAGVDTVLVARSALVRGAPNLVGQGGPEVWMRGDPTASLAALRDAGIRTAGARIAADVARTPSFLAVSWTFDFLQAIGAVTALVAVLGVVLYLQARQQSREVAYALASRMGLRSGAHRLSVWLEVLAMLAVSLVVGAVLASLSVWMVLGKLDVLPSARPGPQFRVPWSLLGAIAVGLLLTAALGAWLVQRRAERANVAEVLRVAN